MTRHFITGGAGFIGSHLTDRLIQKGDAVTVFDNGTSGGYFRLDGMAKAKSFVLVEGDLRDPASLKAAISGHDLVWHLGANADIPGGRETTDLDLTNNTIATHNLLEAMREAGMKKLIFSSTSAVYGDPPATPTAETAGPLLPISLYGASKLACETQISAYCHLFGMQAWMFRFGNVVGGRMLRGVVHDLIAKLVRNPRELEVWGDGQGQKPFFLIEDCIDGMFHAYTMTHSWCDVFNLGCTTTTMVSHIAEIVIEEMGLKNVKIKYTGGRRGFPGDVPELRLDASKMRSLGWYVRRTSDEAVRIAAKRLVLEARSVR